MPPFTLPQTGVPFAPRALRTALIDLLESDPASVDPAEVGPQLLAAVRAGGGHELLPFAGQSAQLVHDIAPPPNSSPASSPPASTRCGAPANSRSV